MDDYGDLGKDGRVHELLRKFKLVGRGWFVQDHWEGDLLAVGVSSRINSDRLVYVAINRSCPDRYDYECEIAAGTSEYETLDRGTQIRYDELVQIMEKHLDVER